jgi:hypothetical protein
VNIFGDIAGWFNGIVGDVTKPITDWFSSLAGQIASAIEGGFIAIFKDLFDVIVGPLELIAGAFILLIAVFLAMKGDMLVGGIARAL